MAEAVQTQNINSEWEIVDPDYSNPKVESLTVHYYPRNPKTHNIAMMYLTLIINTRKIDTLSLKLNVVNYCKSMYYRYTLNCRFKVKILYHNIKNNEFEEFYSD